MGTIKWLRLIYSHSFPQPYIIGMKAERKLKGMKDLELRL